MKYNYLFMICLFFAFTACQSEAHYAEKMLDVEDVMVDVNGSTAASNANAQGQNYSTEAKIPSIISLDTKLVRKGNLSLEVKSIEKCVEQIHKLAILQGGVISKLDLNQSQQNHFANLELKIPSAQFNKTINGLKKMALKVEHAKVDIDDVSTSFKDMETRLRVKKQVRNQLVELMRNEAKNFEEIYYAENQIKELQEEIESVESRFQYLQNQVAFSTISIDLKEPVKVILAANEAPTFFNQFLGQLSGGWFFIKEVILFLAGVWPFIMIVLIGFLLKRRVRNFIYGMY